MLRQALSLSSTLYSYSVALYYKVQFFFFFFFLGILGNRNHLLSTKYRTLYVIPRS